MTTFYVIQLTSLSSAPSKPAASFTPSVGAKTKSRLSAFSAPPETGAPAAEEMDGKIYEHLTLDFLKPEKIKVWWKTNFTVYYYLFTGHWRLLYNLIRRYMCHQEIGNSNCSKLLVLIEFTFCIVHSGC